MNKKGQSLIIFVLILPLIVFFLALFIDTSMMYLKKNRQKEIIRDNIKILLDKNIHDEDKIISVIKENDNNIKVSVNIENETIKISGITRNESIFGKIFNFDVYNLKINYCANYKDKEIKEC